MIRFKSHSKKLLYFGIAIALIISGCAAPRQYSSSQSSPSFSSQPSISSLPVIKPAIQPPITTGQMYHVVQSGETLWRISKRYNVPLSAILRANQIHDVTDIPIGTVLAIPGAEEMPVMYAPIPLFKNTGKWRYIVIHHTATYEGNAGTINRLHLKRGWKNGLGYHFLIDNGTLGHRDGEIEVGHRWTKQMNGAHANKSNMNSQGIGISLVGNFSKQAVSGDQLSSLVYLVNKLKRHYGIPNSRVIRHRDVRGAATECPGQYFPWTRFKSMLD